MCVREREKDISLWMEIDLNVGFINDDDKTFSHSDFYIHFKRI